MTGLLEAAAGLPEGQLHQLADQVAARLAERLAAERHRLLSRTELAVMLGISPKRVKGLVRRGDLPKGLPVGRVCRWDPEEVKRHLAGRAKLRRNR